MYTIISFIDFKQFYSLATNFIRLVQTNFSKPYLYILVLIMYCYYFVFNCEYKCV